MVSLSLQQPRLGFQQFSQENHVGIDSIFGLSGSIWPLIVSLVDLLAAQNAGEDIFFKARFLEGQLSSWIPPSGIDRTDSSQEAMLQITRAFKYTSLLKLYKTCLGDSEVDALSSQSAYHSAVDSLLRTSALSGPMSTMLWPLYTVGLYAEIRDQAIIRGIFSKFEERQHMKVVETANEMVKNSWGTVNSARAGRDQHLLLLG